MKRITKGIIFAIILGAMVFSGYIFAFKKKTSTPQSENLAVPAKNEERKTVATEEESVSRPAPEKSLPAAPEVPDKFSLEMPFYSQAPLGKWDATHEEMCEEASLLNGGLYFLGKKLTADQFEQELLAVKKIEEKNVSTWKSTTIAEIQKVSGIYFVGKIESKIISDPTIESIEAEVSAGHPVVVPLAGRDIGNPNFTPPGPIYHMLVIKGYDSQNFITNDVGTRKGNSYAYKKSVIMGNIHDWNEKNIHLGAKNILVLYK